MGGLYLHIPFCRNKCIYCDFYTGGERIADWNLYINCILNELEERKTELPSPLTTLYIGGGTPSLIPSEFFSRLIHGLRRFGVFNKLTEFTVEVNPEDITDEKINIWKESGVDRVSIGVQSLNNDELNRLKRRHDMVMAEEAIKKLNRSFGNVSVDVMYGIPGQTLETYSETLKKIIDLHPSHISAYSLMLEKGTAMTLLVEQGKISLPNEDEWELLCELTETKLEDGGYERYEISNYSLPGMYSRHNLSYWQGKPYLGLGPGAHSYDGSNLRRWNPNDIKGYFQRYEYSKQNLRSFYSEERLSREEMVEEAIMTGLRTVEGLNLALFEEKFGMKDKEKILQKSARYKEGQLLKEEKGYLSFTRKGFRVSDMILSDLI